MSELIQINDTAAPDLSRREMLRGIALALTAAGVGSLDPVSAQHVHEEVKRGRAADGTYTPQLLTEHEFNTVKRLAELIVPADEKGPERRGRGRGGVHRSCSAVKTKYWPKIYTGGLGWMDARMRLEHGTTFLGASESQQTALLDQLVEAERAAREEDHAWSRIRVRGLSGLRDRRTQSDLARRRAAFSTGCARCRSTPITPAKRA